MNLTMLVGQMLIVIGVTMYTTGLTNYFASQRFISVDKSKAVVIGKYIFRDSMGNVIKPVDDDGKETEPLELLSIKKI